MCHTTARGGTVAWGEMWGNIEFRVPYPGMTLHIPYPEQEGMFTCHTHTVDGHQARMAPQRNHGLPVCVYGPCSGRVWHSWPVSISVVPPLPLSPPPHDRVPPRPAPTIESGRSLERGPTPDRTHDTRAAAIYGYRTCHHLSYGGQARCERGGETGCEADAPHRRPGRPRSVAPKHPQQAEIRAWWRAMVMLVSVHPTWTSHEAARFVENECLRRTSG